MIAVVQDRAKRKPSFPGFGGFAHLPNRACVSLPHGRCRSTIRPSRGSAMLLLERSATVRSRKERAIFAETFLSASSHNTSEAQLARGQTVEKRIEAGAIRSP